ncbi:sugar ABC transporter ATP-binding protein [Sphingomonas sp. PAMC 26621]|uniref:sugar ABC transporter ATP-binding protein n=1 Tax=Sphingomonas sp. PAMC 26621 TaxID=1112213 RepID=UPI0002888E6D|nr:sugar ABC transporter ATP-binding protein [Sphingomonas sp. PAMC 26621]
MTTPALQLTSISKAFAGVPALRDIDLQVEVGEVHALLGENGAGKSTLMKILSGIHQPDAGTVVIDGLERRFAGYGDAVAAGVGTVFQEFSLIPQLNAVDNIFLGREKVRRGALDRPAMKRRATELFERLGVSMDLGVEVRRLSVAQQQFVEIAKALALDARILVLDEPTATLTPADTEHFFATVRTLKAQGVAVIFISHHLHEIFEICDRVTVMRDGAVAGHREVVATGIDDLVSLMIGRRLETSFPPRAGTAGEVLLSVEDLQLTARSPVNSFTVRRGEIFGFAGLVGSGRTETALAVVGALDAHRKRIVVDGHEAKIASPAEALSVGIGMLPEDRKTQGLVTSFSVRDNMSLGNERHYATRGLLIDRGREDQATRAMMDSLSIKASGPFARVENLSGGNQQKVVIGRWLNQNARILFFDEPTRGIDVGAKFEIYRLLRELTSKGYAIVLISSEIGEIVGLCDRVAVFSQGSIMATLESSELSPETIMLHATAEARHVAA